MSVEPVAPGPLALPTVMLMQRSEAGRMTEREAKPALRDLSAREREVAVALGGGSTKREIAEKLADRISVQNLGKGDGDGLVIDRSGGSGPVHLPIAR